MKGLRGKNIFSLFGTNRTWNRLFGHGVSYSIIWGIFNVKMLSVGGINGSPPHQNKLNERARNGWINCLSGHIGIYALMWGTFNVKWNDSKVRK